MNVNKKKQKLQGFVVQTSLFPGSKSEHEGFMLEYGNKFVRLRMKGENPFESEILSHYLNEEVEVEGFLMHNLFLAEEIRRIND